MQADKLRTWLAAARAEYNPDPYRLRIVMEMVQLEFDMGELDTECMWDTIVLLPKGGGEYHNIRLVEVIWKVIAIIIDRSLKDSI